MIEIAFAFLLSKQIYKHTVLTADKVGQFPYRFRYYLFKYNIADVVNSTGTSAVFVVGTAKTLLIFL